ncbi:nucleoside phosphorylase domain-containing protein [Aspergillus pseudoustus]|uniref:Nucleoside phosphorylase domain-containing protein n=1 Tax=Aspergillus pseudoustus TaxID=1810923 RepID=A0ABR4JCK7_9EURO
MPKRKCSRNDLRKDDAAIRKKYNTPDTTKKGLSIDDYTVGWICALQEEYDSSCRMLDEEFDDLEADEADDNSYTFGRIGPHYVVIGCLPTGVYGTNSAARIARDMARSFPRLRFALLVGIAGGLPTAENDVRLGNVVVSTPQGSFGGVVQYDMGKQLPGGCFQRTGYLNGPPDKLLGVLPVLRRRYNDPRQPDRIAEHIQRMNDMPDYRHPATDCLYHTDYPHQSGTNCSLCDPKYLIPRPDCGGRLVPVHYGTIASGNSLIKDAAIRDEFARSEMYPLCFEMEAAGLMNNLPCIVIRGICDYADSHKNDVWHKYAALAAAAYARELLLTLKQSKVAGLPSWVEDLSHASPTTSVGCSRVLPKKACVGDAFREKSWIGDSPRLGAHIEPRLIVGQKRFSTVTNQSPLYYACFIGLAPAVSLILEGGADPNVYCAAYGGSPLEIASHLGHEAVVRELLAKGANPNLCGNGIGTALQRAVFGGYEAITGILLAAGANPNATP